MGRGRPLGGGALDEGADDDESMMSGRPWQDWEDGIYVTQ
jgi:hypothetical protein